MPRKFLFRRITANKNDKEFSNANKDQKTLKNPKEHMIKRKEKTGIIPSKKNSKRSKK